MSEALVIDIEQLSPNARIPQQGNESDAGYDLATIDGVMLNPGERDVFGTGIAVAIPEGYVGYIKPRSGLAVNSGIDVLGGVIDSGYRGEIKVILLNTGDNMFYATPGTRIAQLVVQPVAKVTFNPITYLTDSARGANGFGSTGVAS